MAKTARTSNIGHLFLLVDILVGFIREVTSDVGI